MYYVAKLSSQQERIKQLKQDRADLELAFHTSISNLKDEVSGLKKDKAEMLEILKSLSDYAGMSDIKREKIDALIARMEK